MSHKTLTITLDKHSYPVYIGQDTLKDPNLFGPHIKGHQVLVISNTRIAPLYLETLRETLTQTAKGPLTLETLCLPDGESYKNFQTLSLILDTLIEHRFERNALIIALGGGVIGDISGFAAAIYLRGIAFIQVPTSLLAQVDASVGGKTAINHPLGKNLIGAFHQPQAVVIDTNTLKTLPRREYTAGLSEVIKYGLINDLDFFEWLEAHVQALVAQNPDILSEVIYSSCANKAKIVMQDEHEHNIRAILNLGHTFAHAIEQNLGYGTWLHGEAVGLGLLLAMDLSMQLGYVPADDVKRLKDLLSQLRIPTLLPEGLSNERLYETMALDKKVKDQHIRFILLKQVGNAIIKENVAKSDVFKTLDKFRP